MIQDFTLHTHTNEFDGKNTSTEMVAAAKQAGFKTIGISNHFIVHPEIRHTKMYDAAMAGGYQTMYTSSFDEVLAKFRPHYEELKQLQDSNPDIRILRGMEVDFFPTTAWHDGFARACEILQPDYIIGSAHFVEYAGALCNVHDMAMVSPESRDEMLKIYWDNVRRTAENGMVNWMAHLDLPKKKKLGEGKKWDDIKAQTIAAIAKAGIPIEINTSGYKLGTGEPYPGPKIMELLAKYNVPVLLSDDAHDVNRIGLHMMNAYDQARQCGIKNFASLQKILDFRKKTL